MRLGFAKVTLCALLPLMLTAAKDSNPPFVLDIPRHAAPSTNVVEGLEAAVRRVWHERQVRAESNGWVNNSGS